MDYNMLRIVDNYDKIIKNDFKNDYIVLESLKAKYSQDADCMQNKEDSQTLTVEAVNGGAGFFIRFTTGDTGWAIDSIDEFKQLLDNFKSKIKAENYEPENSNS